MLRIASSAFEFGLHPASNKETAVNSQYNSIVSCIPLVRASHALSCYACPSREQLCTGDSGRAQDLRIW
jgi:hypothetical protein